ncbi:unnamed protein product [Zymoseptoria tritici ST99CH_3D1]|uniref:Uncharacterized protein n=2 Tax=Zymoseptoria tritici TaxID=1047171 RepID=A0A1X7RL53_ZYMT9|nr:unnamed protein product [Zymoseptoria tritici ST99CH_3D7]SMR46689.1 unnamed protein product [Zymoseptoria tritici ST99CH_1E4]SMR47928.1 unnamed protein product [Zymoseptoria tritici ST99CH_3D1]
MRPQPGEPRLQLLPWGDHLRLSTLIRPVDANDRSHDHLCCKFQGDLESRMHLSGGLQLEICEPDLNARSVAGGQEESCEVSRAVSYGEHPVVVDVKFRLLVCWISFELDESKLAFETIPHRCGMCVPRLFDQDVKFRISAVVHFDGTAWPSAIRAESRVVVV